MAIAPRTVTRTFLARGVDEELGRGGRLQPAVNISAQRIVGGYGVGGRVLDDAEFDAIEHDVGRTALGFVADVALAGHPVRERVVAC